MHKIPRVILCIVLIFNFVIMTKDGQLYAIRLYTYFTDSSRAPTVQWRLVHSIYHTTLHYRRDGFQPHLPSSGSKQPEIQNMS